MIYPQYVLEFPTPGMVTYGKGDFFARLFGILNAGVHQFSRIMDKIAIAFTKSYTSADPELEAERERAVEEAAGHIAGVLTLSDLYGRGLVLQAVEREKAERPQPARFAASAVPANPPTLPPERQEVPRIPFRDAIQAILDRQPVLAPSAGAVSRFYQEGPAFAMARSAEVAVTDSVRRRMAQNLELGATVAEGAADILADLRTQERASDMRGINLAYAETVFRTNGSTAATAGIFRQAMEGETLDYFPALERHAVRDSSARENHLAAHGLLAATLDRIWEKWAPPSGYR